MTSLLAPSNVRRILHVRRPIAMLPVAATGRAPIRADDEAEAPQPAVRRFDDAGLTIASLDSATLLRGQKAIQIEHNGFVYKLQSTRLGKLILTK